jgi:ABC-type uncharacterized transport system permease subunit
MIQVSDFKITKRIFLIVSLSWVDKYAFYNEQNDDAYQLFDKAMEQRVFKFLNVSLISTSKFHTEVSNLLLIDPSNF